LPLRGSWRAPRISVNRLQQIRTPVPMSRDNPVRRPRHRHRVWSFSHTLCTSILPEATSGFHRTSTIDPVVLIHRLFDNLFKDFGTPVFYIHLRVTRAAFDLGVECGKTGAALPDLPFAGFIQARSLLGLNKLQRWLDATWTPVGSKLKDDPRYQKEFLAPDDAAFVYFLVRGEPALGVAGRKRPQPTAPKVIFCASSVRCLCLQTPMLELNDCCPLRCIPSMHCSHGPSFQGISLHRYPPDELYWPHSPPAHLRPQF
jgi:hypothetical protein